MILFYRLFGIFLRIILYFSPVIKNLSKFFLHDTLVYSKDNLLENSVMNNFNNSDSKIVNSDNYLSSIIVQKFFYFIHNNEMAFILFALLDVSIGIIISKINKNKSNFYFELIYLFNPISILNCVNLRLDIFYTFLNLMFIINKNNFVGSFFLLISIMTNPASIFINIFILIYFTFNKEIENYFKFIFRLILSFLFLAFVIYFNNNNGIDDYNSLALISEYSLKLIENTKLIYFNYYFVKDTLPNMGLIWSLLPETFLKFQKFSCIMLINFQLILNIAIICIFYSLDKNYKNINSFLYSLLFIINHLIDRYPTENHYIISLILILQHTEIIKQKVFNLGIYCTIAGYSLIYSRGYPFRMKRSGTSNYLFFQNLTYSAFLIFVILVIINSLYEYINKNEKDKKMKKIIYGIIEKAVHNN